MIRNVMASHTSDSVGLDPADEKIDAQIDAINAVRITWVIPIFVLVHLAHIGIFWPYTPGAVAVRELWRNEVIAVHASLLVFIVGIFLLRALLGRGRLMGLLPGLIGLVYLLGGAALAVVDQRVSPSINPLLSATIGVALVLVIHPVVALFNYAVVLASFLVSVAWIQTNAELLLTIRVNSITALALGFSIAVLQWRNQVRSLRQSGQIVVQQRELEAKNQELTKLATRDPLTGLLNRAQFLIEGNQEVVSMQHEGGTACLVMLDVDDFKRINDTYGHPFGDRILVELASLLTRTCGPADLLSRLGGEEFSLLLPGASLEMGRQIAEKIRLAIAEQPFSAHGRSARVTASFGVAELSPGSKNGLDGCYRAADLALYQAKKDGRNCVRSARWRGDLISLDPVG